LNKLKGTNPSAKRGSSPKVILAGFAAVMLALVVFVIVYKEKVAAGMPVGQRPPEVALTDLMGKRVVIPTDLMGKVVFIHFWRSCCSHCVKEMCTLESFYRKHYAEGIIAFSVGAGEDRSSVSHYIAGLNISYPILLDPDLSAVRRYCVFGIPTTYVLDRQGVLRFKISGEITPDKLDEVSRTLL
jgi:cytochrome c biogenesis protein CcmG, thiol:disulfide interchange protein DsbE